MESILRQLKKYQQTGLTYTEQNVDSKAVIVVPEHNHPFAEMIEAILRSTYPPEPSFDESRKEFTIKSLKALEGYTLPPSAGKLYPVELAVLYYLFYHHKIQLGEHVAESYLSKFLQDIRAKEGSLEKYLIELKDSMDKTATTAFLYRVMLASLGERDNYTVARDILDPKYGPMAADALGVEASAKRAWKGLESIRNEDIEQLIFGRIAYIAFWQISRSPSSTNCNKFLSFKPHNIGQAHYE
jgi:hypothetical protein